MNKKILITIIAGIIIIGAGAIFLFTREEDPVVLQVKEEVRQANETYFSFQNVINAIPQLEISEDVKNDFKMEAAYFGIFGNFNPAKEGAYPEILPYVNIFFNALNNRASARLSYDMGDPAFLKDAPLIGEVAKEDIGVLEKLANTFDSAVLQVKADIPGLSPLIVERNNKTEKYFLEFDRINQKLNALVASLDIYSSSDFRAKIKKLESVNEVFGQLSQYIYLLNIGKGWAYSFEISKTFPEVTNEEKAVINCAKYNPQVAPAGCEPIGFFPGKFQELLRKLETVYLTLID